MTSPIIPPRFNAAPITKPSAVIALVPGADGASVKDARQSGNIFKSILADSIQQVPNTADFATKTVEQFLAGENSDLHQVAVASQKAELTFEFFMQARNKVVQAYQEVMRMQL